MPPTYELRTYTLVTPEAAVEYAQHWRPHLISLAKFNVTTRGVWRSTANPKQVLALVQYGEGDDPADTVKKYMASQEFKDDMAGFEFSKIEKVDTALLEPMEFSPLQ